MRKVISTLLLLATALSVTASVRHQAPKVDPRIELLSIVFRLAESREYMSEDFKAYTERIDRHFGEFRNHKLIHFVRTQLQPAGIGYDAVMSMAICLDDKFALRKDLAPQTLDTRWSTAQAEKFTKLLRKFHRDTRFDRFWQDNSALYAQAEARFGTTFNQIDTGWFGTFYGERSGKHFVVLIGLGNGGHCYGPALNYKDGRREVYAVMGTWATDATGMPCYPSQNYVPLLLHEFSHSFVNRLTEKHKELFRPCAERIFSCLETEMHQQAYGGWVTMLNEALVRTSVIQYMKGHNFPAQQIQHQVRNDQRAGFLWIEGLVAELESYDRQRDRYPSLDAYMLHLAQAYTQYAELVEQFDSRRPRVLSINEFTQGQTDVDAGIKTITINFDRPLAGQGYSVFYGSEGVAAFPKVTKVYYSDDKCSVVMEVVLERGRKYQFLMTGKNFRTPEGMPLRQCEITFHTAE